MERQGRSFTEEYTGGVELSVGHSVAKKLGLRDWVLRRWGR